MVQVKHKWVIYLTDDEVAFIRRHMNVVQENSEGEQTAGAIARADDILHHLRNADAYVTGVDQSDIATGIPE